MSAKSRKSNMATRFAGEQIDEIKVDIGKLQEQSLDAERKKAICDGQVFVLMVQIENIKASLVKGNYEKDNGKDAQS